MKPTLTEDRRFRRALILISAAVLFVSTVVLEPRTVADMVIVAVATGSLLIGLYLSRRAENERAEKAEREKRSLTAAPDVVPEDDELPRREPFGQ
jgi:hypothetical protein